MKYEDLKRLFEGKYDFSRDNLIGAIAFILCATIVLLGGLMYTQNHQQDVFHLHRTIRAEYTYHQYYKELSETQQLLIDRYQSERTLIVDISFYNPSPRQTDSTPNQTAIITESRPGFSVACSHDLKWMLGHYIYIYKRGVFFVEDLMDERWENKLDIMIGSEKEALSLGVLHDMEVVVLGKDIELYYE